ncbi:unnamed protein product [Closterium sp. NIES-54]
MGILSAHTSADLPTKATACKNPCPARAEPPCCPHRPAARRSAARAALLLPALVRAALPAGTLLPSRCPAGSHTAARIALPALPCYCPPCCAPPCWLSPCWLSPYCPRAALLAAAPLCLAHAPPCRLPPALPLHCPALAASRSSLAFDMWLDDLQVYLLSDSRDSVSLFDHTSGASLAPPVTAGSATRSQWLTRDAAACLAVCNHLPLAERAHFGQQKTAKALYDVVVARYSSPATAALGRLILPHLFLELSAFATVEDLITHLLTSDTCYRAALPAEFLDTKLPPMSITLYFIVTHPPDSLREVRDQFLALDPTYLIVDLLEKHLLVAETSVVAAGAARRTPRTPFFEGCSPYPLAPSYASAATVDILEAEDVGAASAPSRKRRNSKGKEGKSGGSGSGDGGGGGSGGGGGGGGGGSDGSGGGSGGFGDGGGGSGGGGGGSGGGSGSGCGGSGGGRGGAVQRGDSGGGQRQQQQRPSKTPTPQQLREWFAQRGASGGSVRCPYVIRTGDRAGQTCEKFHTQHCCFSRLDNARRAKFGDEAERPRWLELLRSGADIFALDYDAILAAMYAMSVSAEGDCYLCVPPDPGIEAAALGASESALPGTAPPEALHTFTLYSGAFRCFFRDSTTLTPLPAPVLVRLADPSVSPVLARSSTVLLCPAVPSGSLSGLHLPSFSTNFVSTTALQDAMVTTTTPGGPVAAICSCRLLTHQTLLWHHCLGHPSLPRLRGMHSRLLVSSLPRSLPPLPPSPAVHCLPCVEGRQRADPHSSSFPPMSAPLQTLHMDVWGPARVSGKDRERYFLLVVDDYTRYTTVFPLRSKGEVLDVLIPYRRPHLHCVGRRRLAMRRCSGSGALVLLSAILPRTSFPLALFPASSLASPLTRLAGSFTTPPHAMSYPLRTSRLMSRLLLPSLPLPHCPSPPPAALPRSRSPSDPLPLAAPVEGAVDSGAARDVASWVAASGGAAFGGAKPASAEPAGAEPGGTELVCAEPGDVESEGAESGGTEPRGTVSARDPARALPRLSHRREPLSPQQLREWFAQGTCVRSGAAGAGGSTVGGTKAGGAGATSPGGAGVTTGARGTGGAGAAGHGRALTSGTGAARAGGVGGAGAGDPSAECTRARDPGAGGTGARDPGAGGPRGTGGAGAAGPGGARSRGASAGGAGAGGAGVGDPGAGGAGTGGAGAGGPGAEGTVQRRPFFVPPPPSSLPPPDLVLRHPDSPLPAPSPYAEQTDSLIERREPQSRPALPVRAVCTSRHVLRPRPPPVPGTHIMALRPSSVPLRVPLPPPPESSLPAIPDPESDLARAASPTVPRLPATVVTDPSFESTSACALFAGLLDFAATCRLDYAISLIAESESDCPPSVDGECALGTDVLEDRQEDFECLAAALPHLVAMLLAPEGDPDALDIPTPRSYAEAIMGPYSS